MAMSFLTSVPVGNDIDWNKDNLRYFCIMLPIIGAVIGILLACANFLITNFSGRSNFFNGALMTLCNLIITGGLHFDGFIDTCDALFSHRDMEARLKIMSDPNIGAFGAAGCVMNLIFKCALFGEINFNFKLVLIPVLSRLGMALLLNNLPFAKSDGLAKILGSARVKHDNIYFIILAIISALIDCRLTFINFLVFILWRRCCMKNFNGITGDLLGAYIELDEIILLLCI